MKRLGISLLVAAACLPAGCCNCCSHPSSPGPSCTTPPSSYATPPSSYATPASPYGMGSSPGTSSYGTPPASSAPYTAR